MWPALTLLGKNNELILGEISVHAHVSCIRPCAVVNTQLTRVVGGYTKHSTTILSLSAEI